MGYDLVEADLRRRDVRPERNMTRSVVRLTMSKLTGRLLMATAVGHAFVGVVLFRDSIAAIVDDGFVNAVQPPFYAGEPHFDRIAAFWFLLFSPVLFLLGQITNRAIERRDAPTLKLVGWNLMGIGVFGSVVLPISGNWILIALAAIVLRAASSARGDVPLAVELNA
jgi:hypothetical protein